MDLRFTPSLSPRSTLLVALLLLAGRTSAAQESYLLGPAPLGGDVRRFEVSPDGHWAVYVDGFLHGVEVAGGEKPRRLDPRPEIDPPGLAPAPFTISPDSRRVVYGALDGTARLASVPLDGSAPPVDLHDQLGLYEITPDSHRVVMSSASGLVSLAIDGTSPAVVIVPRPIGGFVVTPDSTRVVYTIQGILWVAPLDGSAPPLQLNVAATMAGTLLMPPAGERVVYRRGALQTTGDLFSVPLDGSSSPVQLNAPGFYNVNWIPTTKPRFTPDGRSIAYTEDIAFLPREHRLFVAPVDGSAPAVGLSTSLGLDGVFSWEFVGAGADVLFVHADVYDAQLFRCASDGTEAPLSLSAPIPETWYFKVPPGGTRAVFTARDFPGAPFELWSVPIDGSEAPLRLSDPLARDGVLNHREGFGFAQEGRLVVYATDRENDFSIIEPSDVLRIWAVPIDGSAPPVRIDGPMIRGRSARFTPFNPSTDSSGGVYGGVMFRIAAGGKRLLYLADQRENDVFELFAAPLPAEMPGPGFTARGR